MRKILYVISSISILLFVFATAVMFYWLNYPYNVLKINKSPFKVDKTVYNAGDQMIFTIDYCKYINLPSEVYKSFIDTIVYNVATITTNNPIGCSVNRMITVTPNLPNGKYYLRLTYRYKVNPLRTIEVAVNSETFDIILNDDNASGHK